MLFWGAGVGCACVYFGLFCSVFLTKKQNNQLSKSFEQESRKKLAPTFFPLWRTKLSNKN